MAEEKEKKSQVKIFEDDLRHAATTRGEDPVQFVGQQMQALEPYLDAYFKKSGKKIENTRDGRFALEDFVAFVNDPKTEEIANAKKSDAIAATNTLASKGFAVTQKELDNPGAEVDTDKKKEESSWFTPGNMALAAGAVLGGILLSAIGVPVLVLALIAVLAAVAFIAYQSFNQGEEQAHTPGAGAKSQSQATGHAQQQGQGAGAPDLKVGDGKADDKKASVEMPVVKKANDVSEVKYGNIDLKVDGKDVKYDVVMIGNTDGKKFTRTGFELRPPEGEKIEYNIKDADKQAPYKMYKDKIDVNKDAQAMDLGKLKDSAQRHLDSQRDRDKGAEVGANVEDARAKALAVFVSDKNHQPTLQEIPGVKGNTTLIYAASDGKGGAISRTFKAEIQGNDVVLKSVSSVRDGVTTDEPLTEKGGPLKILNVAQNGKVDDRKLLNHDLFKDTIKSVNDFEAKSNIPLKVVQNAPPVTPIGNLAQLGKGQQFTA